MTHHLTLVRRTITKRSTNNKFWGVEGKRVKMVARADSESTSPLAEDTHHAGGGPSIARLTEGVTRYQVGRRWGRLRAGDCN